MPSLANPETLDTWKTQYRHKVVLLLLVYLLIPAAPSESAPHTSRLASSVSSSSGDALHHPPPAIVSWSNKLPVQVEYPLPHVAGPSEPRRRDHVAPPEPSASPLSIWRLPNDAHKKTLPVNLRESTSRFQETTDSLSLFSPPLSDPPSPAATRVEASPSTSVPATGDSSPPDSSSTVPASTVDESECPIDYRGRPMCPGVEREQPSFSARSAELSSEFADAVHEFGLWLLSTLLSFRVTLSPFKLFVLIIHTLSLGQLVALIVEDSIVRTTLANPMPTPFPIAANSFSKRMSRYRWRLEATWVRFWKSIILLGLLLGCGAALIREGQWGPRNARRGGWDDVPFAQWVLPGIVEAHKGVRKGPLRDLVLLEACGLMLCLLQPLKHLVPTSILPSTLAPPASLYPPLHTSTPSSLTGHASESSRRKSKRLPPQLQLDTSWLISLFVDVTLSLITLLQLLRCGLLLPTISPLTVAPHLLFHTARGRIHAIVQARMTLLRTIECLVTVFKLFPEEQDETIIPTTTTTMEGSDDSEWVCTICFEGAAVEEVEQGSNANFETGSSGSGDQMVARPLMTVRAKCRLPCGHKYHAGCLTQWFHHQTFCPCCHVPISSSTPLSTPANSLPGSPRMGGGAGGGGGGVRNASSNSGALFGLPPLGEEEEVTSDLYPAQLRMSGGEGSGSRVRRRVVDLGPSEQVEGEHLGSDGVEVG
ncbi:BQ2448_1470 [Microbotryum intermedium]|uniref:BQ2448_1470 protein n=1 Tax=Microbotryum intermedium TaxID=269621 RepID=A0A238FGA7_9BASI|nr:BQ2448_1470 [Microbotryum intermedium]